MKQSDLTKDHHQAFAVAACLGSEEAIQVMSDLISQAIAEGMTAVEFSVRIQKSGPYKLLERAGQIIDEALTAAPQEASDFTWGPATWALKEMSKYAYESWGITDQSVSIRILHQAALTRAQPEKLLAGLFNSLSGDVKKDRK
ncbi:hypothetical protein [Marinobacter subterrani]|uniref:Uncharacterized protein n=1 Tax=Marinobacter subterrani TaxID=1658765 RepID=A0A0J7JA85_9GAMM|nr:hypothetical protein [Marinobacter subterrani]KMQ73755.1 hypothetical protein Msub_20976 [Marinobacter subterrani]KMQ75363.1 hypothetical protein Msub_11565 [Marinobacter subterrani]KMQ76983.1 hypothetical protein Msub_13198 [Marinobacter subterrani]